MRAVDQAYYLSLTAALAVFLTGSGDLGGEMINKGEVVIHASPATFSGVIDQYNLLDAVHAATRRPDRTVTVTESPGGRVIGAIQAANYARAEGIRFHIEGDCLSACAILLGVPGSCVNGRVGGHSAHDGYGERNVPATGFLRQFFPEALDKEFVRLGAYYRVEMTFISQARLRELGIPAC